MGRLMPTLSPTRRVATPMITGIVKSVMMLLRAVRVTESATSPLASLENTLDELPPGQHAMRIRPIKNTGVSLNAVASPSAMSGSRTSCPKRAITMGQGRDTTLPKSSNLSVSPRSNIKRASIGSTIQMAITKTFLDCEVTTLFSFPASFPHNTGGVLDFQGTSLSEPSFPEGTSHGWPRGSRTQNRQV